MVKLREEQLKKVLKPARYVAGEYNQVIKDKDDINVRFALIYPDLYERGMSDLKYTSSYYTINKRNDTWCERVFAPWDDFEKLMKKEKIELYGLESKDELNKFDILCLNIDDVLEYTNILNMLDLAKIPLFSKERIYDFPFVMVANSKIESTAPIDAYVDLYVTIPDDKIYSDVLDIYIKWKKDKKSKANFLEQIKNIKGVYVPSIDGQGIYQKNNIVSCKYNSCICDKMLVPNMQIDKNYIEFEVENSNTNEDEIIKNMETVTANTGISKIGFIPIDDKKYSRYSIFREKLFQFCEKRDIGISINSLNVYNIDSELLKRASICRKDRININIMSANEGLRKKLGLDISDNRILENIYLLLQYGINKLAIELYIGIKDETYMDIDNAINFISKIKDMYSSNQKLKQENRLNILLKVKIYQNIEDATNLNYDLICIQKLEMKVKFLMQELDKINIRYIIESPKVSQIKKMLTYGNDEMSRVIYMAWRNGAKLDKYEDKYKLEAWEKAILKR